MPFFIVVVTKTHKLEALNPSDVGLTVKIQNQRQMKIVLATP